MLNVYKKMIRIRKDVGKIEKGLRIEEIKANIIDKN